MAEARALEEMGEDDVLAFADACAETIRQAEADLLRAAYQWAILHDPARLDPPSAALPGRERARRLGGDGTPEVREFAAAEFGARIGRSPYAAAQLMADALDLHHRLPQLWARVEAGEVRASYARHVCKMTRDLTKDEAAYVDAAVAEPADGRITWSRFEALVEAQGRRRGTRSRPREGRASRQGHVRQEAPQPRPTAWAPSWSAPTSPPSTPSTPPSPPAPTSWTSRCPTPTDDERRVHAVLLLANPGADARAPTADLLPTVQLYLHSYAGPDADTEHGQIARLEGHGPVTEAWITRRPRPPRASSRSRPVLDLAGQAPVDAYEIPNRHSQAVHLMTPADTFPFASSLSRTKQVDHTIPYDEGGESGIGNYGPMTVLHHRIKTHGRWQVQQPFPGIYIWRDPDGAFYLVDNTGTRPLRDAA